jgi:hypothetical protein
MLYPGGIREDGFVKLWSRALRRDRLAYDVREAQLPPALPGWPLSWPRW